MRPRRRSRRPRALLGTPFVALTVIAVAVVVGLTAANTVAASKATDNNRTVTANDLAPVECAALSLASVVNGVNGTNGADLLLGTSAGENLDGNAGDDCILGGGGNDNLRGSGGTDVCIGGPGTDTFHPSCETQIQ